MRSLLLLPFLLLTACPGSVHLEDVDGFGPGLSSVWFHYDAGEIEYDSIVLTNVAGACAKAQMLAEAQKDAEDAQEDADEDSYCEDMEKPYKDWARAADALYHDGAHYLTMTVYEGLDTEPDDDTYDVGGMPQGLTGQMTYYENSPYAVILSDWDPDEDAEDNCGVDEDDLDVSTDTWSLSDGDLELTRVDDEKSLAGKLDAELHDDDGDNAGDIIASLSAAWCEVDL